MTDIVPVEGYTNSQVELIKSTVARGASDDELKLFLYTAKRTGLDPLIRQIHFTKRGDRTAMIVAIDGYRLIAERTGKYAGNDEPVYESDGDGNPTLARVTVWKLVNGERCPFSASARWREYAPEGNQGFMWRKMPFLMLGKVAEALALRKAFPADLSGIYVAEEMDQAEVEPKRSTVVNEPPALRPPLEVSAPKATNGNGKASPKTPIAEGRNFYRCAHCGKGINGGKKPNGEFLDARQVAQLAIDKCGVQLCGPCMSGVKNGTIVLRPQAQAEPEPLPPMADDDDEPVLAEA